MLTVVVPCYNEEAVIEETHRRLSTTLSELEDLAHEILYVDDGSRDGTPDILARLAAEEPGVRVLELSRNFGHQIAVTAICRMLPRSSGRWCAGGVRGTR
jgi:glycosyltransferase involved in cell wall biosynthesis